MIDVAKRLTAASFIGVGRAICRVQLHAGCPAGRAAAQSSHQERYCLLIGARVESDVH